MASTAALCILPNLPTHTINFPHQTDTDGTFIQTKTVKTIVRVGQLLPAASMRLSMSLHDGTGEITPGRVISGKPIYNGKDNSMTQEMRPEKPPQDESDGGVAREACVAEATFSFKFSVTAAQTVSGSTQSRVWLRFSVDGSPNLYVETRPFRLVAKKDEARESVQTLVNRTFNSFKQVLYREGQ